MKALMSLTTLCAMSQVKHVEILHTVQNAEDFRFAV